MNLNLQGFQNKYPTCYAQIVTQTNFLPEINSTKLIQRIWHIRNNINQTVLCKHCNIVSVNWRIRFKRYNEFCSSKCAALNVSTKNKRTLSNQHLYGLQYNLHFADKRKQTLIKNHGIINASQIPKVQQQKIENSKKKWGCDYPLQNPEVRQRIKHTCQNKYGTDNFCFDRLDKYTLLLINDPSWLRDQHYNQNKTLIEIACDLNISNSIVGRYFNKHDIKVKRHPNSIIEKQCVDFLSSIYLGAIHTNVRDIIPPYELDVFIPKHNIAIEFNGVYWHTERTGRGRTFHKYKTDQCKIAGIELLQLWDYEWIEKQDIVKSMLQYKLKSTQNVVYARNCYVLPIAYDIKQQFVNANHIQGDCPSKLNYGLFEKGTNDLVGVMTLGIPRFTKADYEIIRLCFKLGTRITGGASKLFKHFINEINPNTVVTYADRRFSSGNIYKQLGFKFSHTTTPGYFYTSGNKIYSRLMCQKHKLQKLLPMFDPQLSANQNMENNNFYRIWDCGHEVFTLKTKY